VAGTISVQEKKGTRGANRGSEAYLDCDEKVPLARAARIFPFAWRRKLCGGISWWI